MSSIRRIFALLSCPVLLLVALTQCVSGADEFRITEDVVYGHKAGMALTYDVIQHTTADNDAAVAFMVSGGWNSGWMNPKNFINPFAPDGFKHFRQLVKAGYTLYIVRHLSLIHI